MARKSPFQKNNGSKRVRKRGEFFSFLVAAILIVGFFAVSHYMFFGYGKRKVASVAPVITDLRCDNLLPLLKAEDQDTRFRASVALASCGYPQAIDGLITFLDSTDPALQKAAAFTLLSQQLTLKDQAIISKIENQKSKINSLINQPINQ